MVDPIRSDMSKTVKGIKFKYLSFVNLTSALNVCTTEEGLSLQFKDLDNCQWIVSQVKFKPWKSQAKSKEGLVMILYAGHSKYFQ